MSNCMLGFPNIIDSATLSDGAYVATLPRTYIQTRKIKQVARTVDDALASTKVKLDFGALKSARILAVINHNLSLAAKFRIRGHSEGAVTQLWDYCNFDAAHWSTFAPGITADAAKAPDGTTTAVLMNEATASGQIARRPFTALAGNMMQSFYTKADTATTRAFGHYNGSLGADLQFGTFNYVTGTLTPLIGSVSDWLVTALPDGWYRISIPLKNLTAGHTIYFYYGLAGAAAGSARWYMWHAMLYAGNVEYSDYPNLGAGTVVKPAGYFDSWQNYGYNSGWKDVWPVVYSASALEWEDPSWFGGKYSDEQIEGYTATLTHILPQAMLMRYWLVEFDDQTNPDGYVEYGRMFVGPAWQPRINQAWGASTAWESNTEVQQAQGGAESFTVRTPYRVDRYKLDGMTRDEAMTNAFEIQRRAGVDKEVMWVQDPADTLHSLRTQYLARLRTLSPIEYPYYNTNTTAFEIKELQ